MIVRDHVMRMRLEKILVTLHFDAPASIAFEVKCMWQQTGDEARVSGKIVLATIEGADNIPSRWCSQVLNQ